MAKMHEVAKMATPPPPKEAERLFKKAQEPKVPAAVRPPRGWVDEDEVISLLNSSREELTKLSQDGYFEVTGYATSRGNRRCFKKDGVELFAKVFPKGSQPTGEGSRMLILGALAFAKGRVASGEDYTAKEAMDAAYETVTIAKWVYDGGVNRRPKNKPDKDTGIYRWPTEEQRREYAAYVKNSAKEQAKAEAEAKTLQEALDAQRAKEAEEQELFERAVQAEVTEIISWLGETPSATDEEIETVISSSKPEIQDSVRTRIQAFVADARHELTEEEIDQKLFNVMNTKANRSPFVMHAIYACARTRNAAFLSYNLTTCEQYAAARFRVASWMRAHNVRQPTAVDVRFDPYIYPTHDDYVAFLAWLHVKREDTTKTMDAANAIIREFASSRKDHELSETQIGMIHKALKDEGWKEPVVIETPVVEQAITIVEEPKAVEVTHPEYYIDASLAKTRFNLSGDNLEVLVNWRAIRTTQMNLVGESNAPVTAYNELDLALFQYATDKSKSVRGMGVLVGEIKTLRQDATYENGILRIKGKIPNTTKSEALNEVITEKKSDVDIFLSIAEISAKLTMHVATVGAIAKLGIARSSGQLVSLLDVTIMRDLFDSRPELGTPTYESMKAEADTLKKFVASEHQYYKYSPTKAAYVEIRMDKKKNTKKAPAKPTKKAAAQKPAAAVVPKAEKVVAKPIVSKRETPAEEKIKESEIAEAVSKLPPTMTPHKTAYKMFGIAVGRLKVLIEQGVLRGDSKMVALEDCSVFNTEFPDDIVGMDLKKVKSVMVAERKKSKAVKPSPAVANMINTAEAVLARKDDSDAELVMIVPKFKSLDDVVLFFSGAVMERYGADPDGWPDVMRGLGLGLGVIKKSG